MSSVSKLKALAEELIEARTGIGSVRNAVNIMVEYHDAVTPERVAVLCRIVMAVDRPEVRYELDDVKAAFLDLEAAFKEDTEQ